MSQRNIVGEPQTRLKRQQPASTNRMQPYHVFKCELAYLNEVYWTVRYSLERTPAALAAIAATASTDPDVPVSEVWRSPDLRMQRQLNGPVAEFAKLSQQSVVAVRAFSIVGICSAFENALVNYFALASIHQPKRSLSSWNGLAAPKILKDRAGFARLQKASLERAAEVLRASYSTRVRILLETFRVSADGLLIPDKLDSYVDQRHLLAHNQGVADDGPWLRPSDIVATRISMSETEWQSMLGDFDGLLQRIDVALRSAIPDHASGVAIDQVLRELDGSVKLGILRDRVNVGWHLHETPAAIERVALELGCTIQRNVV